MVAAVTIGSVFHIAFWVKAEHAGEYLAVRLGVIDKGVYVAIVVYGG
ncbi:hypothetical protein ACFLUG_02660 [Chloroflexota bacterium]